MSWWVRRRVSTRSRTIDPMISAPTTAPCQKSLMPRIGSARLMVTRRKAPSAAPHTVPLPPKIATPPITTAATACSSRSRPGERGGVARDVEDARETGQGPGEHERAEHALADVEAVEPGGVGVGADGVQLTTAAGGVEVVADDGQHDETDDRQERD